MTRIVNVDPKGSIPTVAINLGIKKAGDASVTLLETVSKASKRWPKPQTVTEPVPSQGEMPSFEAHGTDTQGLVEPQRLWEMEDQSDDEHLFFETSSLFEVPGHVVQEKIEPLQQRLSFVENNTLQTNRQLESLQRKTKGLKRVLRRSGPVGFDQLSRFTRLAIFLWPAVLYLLLQAFLRFRKVNSRRTSSIGSLTK
jgi:hypothetical protein